MYCIYRRGWRPRQRQEALEFVKFRDKFDKFYSAFGKYNTGRCFGVRALNLGDVRVRKIEVVELSEASEEKFVGGDANKGIIGHFFRLRQMQH
jgi:hypothetical protein